MRVPSGEKAGAACWRVLEINLEGSPASVGRVPQIQLPDVGIDRSLHVSKQVAADRWKRGGTGHVRDVRYRLFASASGDAPQLISAENNFAIIGGPGETVDEFANGVGGDQACSPPPGGIIYTSFQVEGVALKSHGLAVVGECRISVPFRVWRRISDLAPL